MKRETLRVGHAVVVVGDRVNAGTVAVALLLQDVERPQIGRADGKTGRAIALHGDAGDVFQQPFAAPDVVGEFGAALVGDAVVGVAVAGQLVPGRDDAAHHRGMAFG